MIENIIAAYNTYWALNNAYNQIPLGKYLLDKISNRSKRTEKKLEEYPDIHIILAAYKEENVLSTTVENCINTLHNFYPGKGKLWLTLEEDDKQTQEVAFKLKEKYPKDIEILIVDKNSKGIRGKPRALNYAFSKISEEIEKEGKEKTSIIGVLDAEDIVPKDFFKEVVQKIYQEDYDAVQAKLDMKNCDDGWKNHMDRATYGWWYRLLLPSKAFNYLPVPLGGSGNFFKYETLTKMIENEIEAPWDANNLTEDFDLGMRMYLRGLTIVPTSISTVIEDMKKEYKIGIVENDIKQESPVTWEGWLKQKTRWQQGKLQTLKKILKRTYEEVRKKEFKKAFHPKKFAVLLECSTPHLGAINLTGISFSTYIYLNNYDLKELSPLFWYNLMSIGFYCALNGIGYYFATKNDENKTKKEIIKGSLIAALTTPAYWFAYWLADLRALKREYIDKARDWEKTEHEGRHIFEKSYPLHEERKGTFSSLKNKFVKNIKNKISTKTKNIKKYLEYFTKNYGSVVGGAILGACAVRAYEDPDTFLQAVENVITMKATYFPYFYDSLQGAIGGSFLGWLGVNIPFYRKNNKQKTSVKEIEDYLLSLDYIGKKTINGIIRYLKNGEDIEKIERFLRKKRIRKNIRENVINYLKEKYYKKSGKGNEGKERIILNGNEIDLQMLKDKLMSIKYVGKKTTNDIIRYYKNYGNLDFKEIEYILEKNKIRYKTRKEIENILKNFV